ncbi:MAG TPA: hypothetical protein VJ717_08270 [Gemmatimonadaceae bacterium]|nr:hypothetical protein [Gemmatimonadaceae bacterium]
MEPTDTVVPPPDTRTLAELVAAAARRTSDGRLVACAVTGIVGVAAIALFLRFMWWLTPVMLGIAAFGGWGIADRERAALGTRGTVFRGVRVVAMLVGGAAAAFAAFLLFVVFVGRLIS